MTTLLLAFLMFAQADTQRSVAAPSVALQLDVVIPMRGVEGRIDHMHFAPSSGVLFVAALENGTVEQILVATRHVDPSIEEPYQPCAVAYDQDVIFVTDQNLGAVWSFPDLRAADSFTPPWKPKHVEIGPDVDNVRLLVKSRDLLVGYGAGGLA